MTNTNILQAKNGKRIYLQGIKETTPRLLHEGGNSPQWFAEGKRIAFLKAVDGVPQLFELGLEPEAQPKQLTASPERIP